MTSQAAWLRALAEHDAVLEQLTGDVASFPPSLWHRREAPARWTAAELTLHVIRSYELGRAALDGAPSMSLRVPRPLAWLSRTVLLPAFLATRTFPRGAESPGEVIPDAEEAATLTPQGAARRLRIAGAETTRALLAAGERRDVPRFTHAYFGPLPPRLTLRLLAAHTRHHRGGLAARAAGAEAR